MENLRTPTLAARKRTILVLFFIISSILTAFSFAQPSITWQRTYDSPFNRDEGFYSICDAGNDNFYIAGYSETSNSSGFYILKIKPNGDTIWARIIGGRNLGQGTSKILPLSDGGCIFSGSNDTAFTLRLNSAGDIVWYKTYPVSGSFQYTDIYDMIKTSDGGYAMCGKIFGQAGCIYKLDSLGNLIWNRIDVEGFRKTYNLMIETNNNFWVAGRVDNVTVTNTIIINFSNTGDSLWQKQYNFFGFGILPGSLNKIGDMCFFFGSAYITSQNRFINCFLKIDINGNIQDSVLINAPFSKSDLLQESFVINANRYLIASYRAGTSASDTTFAISKIIDSLGNVLQFKGFEGFEWSEFHSCIKSNNGDLLFVGNASRFNQNDFDGYAVRTDSNLNVKPFGIEPISGIIPERIKLYQNFPNPFNPVTKIQFDAGTERRTNIKLSIYDILGREITMLVNEEINAGTYEVQWDASAYPSGIYFYQLKADGYTETKKMVLIK